MPQARDDVLRLQAMSAGWCACYDGRYESCVCLEGTLDWFRTQIVGEWAGTRTTPWDQETVLLFDFWATWGGEYGPVSFELERQE